jgi:integrase
MLSLGYGCGLRAGEIVRLKAGDIDSAQMIIRIVQSKGRKDRHVMLPPELLVSLRQWWKVRPTRFDADVPMRERWLFPVRRQGQHLTYRQLSRIFHEAAVAAGITKRVSLHSLRHSFATDLLEARAPRRSQRCPRIVDVAAQRWAWLMRHARSASFLACGAIMRREPALLPSWEITRHEERTKTSVPQIEAE